MQELLLLAKSKGFQPRTFSTIWIFRGFIGEGKKIVINKDCESNLLCEIQRWLREVHKISIYVDWGTVFNMVKWHFELSNISTNSILTKTKYFDTYEQAMESGLFEALKLIK